MVGGFLCLATMLVSGKVADRLGRVRTLWWATIIIALFCLPAPILGNTDFGSRAFIPSGFAVLGFALAQAAGAVNSCFDRQDRYSGALITNELGWLVGAGFAPLIALVIAHTLGNAGVALYVIVAAAASILSLQVSMSNIESREQE
jgi:MFS family permease